MEIILEQPFIKEKISVANYYEQLIQTINRMNISSIETAIGHIKNAWMADKQIICFGNGGSALTAQHFMTDWNKCVYMASGRPFRGRCLTENMGLLSAYGNDVDYQSIFVEQLKTVMQKGDIVIAISGSGNSENVLRAVEYANSRGNLTIGLCGFDGGKLAAMCCHAVLAPVHDMQISEDIHFIFGHLVMKVLCSSQSNNLL